MGMSGNFNHIRSVAGVDSIGIGSDFNGMDQVACGLEDVSKFPRLLVALIKDKVVDSRLYMFKVYPIYILDFSLVR